MYRRILRKRILKGLVVALALFAVIPAMNAAAKPVSPSDDPYPRPVLNNSQSQFGVTAAERRADILRGQALNKRYQLGQYALSSEISTGLQAPSQPQTVAVSTGSDFEWGNAGIGAGIAALLIAGTAAALAVRSRHHGGLAH